MYLTNWERISLLQLEDRKLALRARKEIHKSRTECPSLLDHMGWRVGGLLIALGGGVQALADRRVESQPVVETEEIRNA